MAKRVRTNSTGYNTVVTVPPANPPDRNDDIIARRFCRVSGSLFDGIRKLQTNSGDIAFLYQSINRKFIAEVPPCLITFGVLPICIVYAKSTYDMSKMK